MSVKDLNNEGVRIAALFLDFDGTLSPANVPRESAEVPAPVKSSLEEIARLLPVSIITTKDMSFICERTRFAGAWAAIGGLEVKIGEKVFISQRAEDKLPLIKIALDHAERRVKEIDKKIYVEKKAASNGAVAAFCIDWRLTEDWNSIKVKIEPLLRFYGRLGLSVYRYEGRPYSDVYPIEVSKGDALLVLKRELKIGGPLMYMGDSETDNPAFDLADVSIGVVHSETYPLLKCDYLVRFVDVQKFLRELLDNNLIFSPHFTTITPSSRTVR
jgi:HAD superfamily hydrolase (TIGR01484 family)